ncbi:beta-propeller domain-containing protein [Psychrobacillus sp. NEAU-3TGS]|uniref:beta-propeller domain-containing protein n=1 Tax=Psychrobacillus sp. NEAU-3TGS TaxID=2995412 RepID=UPI00249905FF|nr:beta-propeller domain-containing protein [Psychrobacillus sp. NEAU-3TGS]MDI2587889.1 beta-propeller domain-containing protein [Psychrobacillus sp. NEAU-3TGS]
MKKWLISTVAFAFIIGMAGAFYFSKTEISAQSFKESDEIQPVQSKEQLKAYFEKIREIQKQQNNGAEVTEESANTMEAKDSSGGNSGGYSTTNNQVEGVDEADTVKTNGKHVFSVSESNVVIANVKDPKQMKEETTISFKNDFYPTQLLLSDQTLMVLGQKNVLRKLEAESTQKMNSVMMPMDSMTTVYFYDISNPAKPKLMREIATEGYMNGARLNNNTLYYVTTIYPKFWMMEENADVELRPFTYDSKFDKEAKPMNYDSIAILPSSMEGNYSIISAINVSKPAENEVKTKGYLGGSEQLYMSKDNLYLTSTIYEQNNINAKKMIWNPGEMDTEVFKFALDKTSVKFVASSRLTGTILNQFSMDEHNGYFRAVTTKGNSWNENKVSENNLFILDDKMKTVGSLTGLAKDERIYSARFMGDKAYMVTFKETDPLFVIDVAKPTDPKVLGELKIPGFSNYLHPLDENHLIGFGYETIVDTQSGGKQPVIMTGGMKISLFDVSDFAKPKELDTEIIGDQGTYSPVQYDHHALFEYKEKGLYGFPISIYRKGKEYAEFKQDGALIYEITPENGIVLKGDLLNPEDPKQQYENWETSIQRMIYVEDSLYTIAMKEIKSYNLNSFKQLSKMSY